MDDDAGRQPGRARPVTAGQLAELPPIRVRVGSAEFLPPDSLALLMFERGVARVEPLGGAGDHREVAVTRVERRGDELALFAEVSPGVPVSHVVLVEDPSGDRERAWAAVFRDGEAREVAG